MNKREKLKQLDNLVLDKMTEMIKSGQTEELSDLSVPVNYLKSNQEVSEKEKRTANDKQKELIEKYNKRRLDVKRKDTDSK